MTKTITRDEIKDILVKWGDGHMSAGEVHNWADARFMVDAYDYEDWEGAEENSVSNEVLGKLDMLDINLLTPQDIPSFLTFLSTPKDRFHEGHSELERYLDSVDIGARKKQLNLWIPIKSFLHLRNNGCVQALQ